EQLERPLPALLLERVGRADHDQRPHEHHRRPERRAQEQPRILLRVEQVVRDRRVEDRPQDDAAQVEGVARKLHEVDPHPAEKRARHASRTSSTYASSSVGSRAITLPTFVPSSSRSSACTSSGPVADWTSSTCVCSRDSVPTAATPGTSRRRAITSSPTPNVSISITERSATRALRSAGVPYATNRPPAMTAMR